MNLQQKSIPRSGVCSMAIKHKDKERVEGVPGMPYTKLLDTLRASSAQ